jgi:hypothetical protein
MGERSWLSGLLFYFTLIGAGALGLLALVAPILPAGAQDLPILKVFSHDGTVRRTALASAAGLTVTAFVFFRPAVSAKKAKYRRPPPSTMAGA